ncbi:MAG: hypothetical protein K0S01_390 [Herbinix sp.]|jgi:hypothetical protein|nr:hypothetical protein [Herbinix sp.]
MYSCIQYLEQGAGRLEKGDWENIGQNRNCTLTGKERN